MADERAFRGFEERLWSSVGVEPTERRLDLGGLGTTVRVQEIGTGPTVLFVHGASNAGASWASLVAELDGFHSVLLDRPGCGLSDPLPASVTGSNLDAVKSVADRLIPDVLDALGTSNAHVAATSYGGFFAFRAAAAQPDRIDRLMEFSWPMGAPMTKVPLVMRLAAIPGLDSLSAKMPVTRSAAKVILRQVGLAAALRSGRFTDEMLDWFVALLTHTDSLRNEIESTPKVITPLAGLNTDMLFSDELLERATMPVSFFWGEDDPNGGAELGRRFAARLPNARFEAVAGAGHAPWIDEIDRAASSTRTFLDR